MEFELDSNYLKSALDTLHAGLRPINVEIVEDTFAEKSYQLLIDVTPSSDLALLHVRHILPSGVTRPKTSVSVADVYAEPSNYGVIHPWSSTTEIVGREPTKAEILASDGYVGAAPRKICYGALNVDAICFNLIDDCYG